VAVVLSRAAVLALAVAWTALAATPAAQGRRRSVAELEALPYAPRRAICYRTATRLEVDGKLDEPAWRAASWSEPFIDIRGSVQPRFTTRARLLWDDQHFYLAAELEEPHLWGTLVERDSVIFQDNDFEVFIDPDGDTHGYYELEVNVLGTAWDLLLIQPYRDGGPPIHGWDIPGLRIGIDARGTINDASDRDLGWTVEIAIPWQALREWAPGRRAPRDGEQWRVNFSRVQWETDVQDGSYRKRVDRATGKPLAEDNWVWSPQGIIDMHAPERWGFVQFSDHVSGTQTARFLEDPDDRVKWLLRRLYYRQREFRAKHERYASGIAALDASAVTAESGVTAILQSTDSLFEIAAPGSKGSTVRIRQDGKIWVDP
jgi:Carbohydrate family 9 binding domain-like